jgi:hypothetical protein
MSEPNQGPASAPPALSVILFAEALSTQTADALAAWKGYLDGRRAAYEILLIQETRPEVPPSADEPARPDIRCFAYDRASGFRAALNDAVAATQHPWVVFCPCDLQYQPGDLDGMLKVMAAEEQVDLVVGYRKGGQAPPWRVFLDTALGVFCRVILGVPIEPRVCWLGSAGWGRRWVARWIFGLRVLDPECPFRIIRRALLARFPIQSGGPFAQVEMLAKANHLSGMMTQEPVTWTAPATPASAAISFGDDAWRVFRTPDFGAFKPPATESASAPAASLELASDAVSKPATDETPIKHG